MSNVLFYGDTERSAAMRHELPVAIIDPFLMGIVDGRLHVEASPLERDRIAAAAPDAVLHDMGGLGLAELRAQGADGLALDVELASRAAAAMGVTDAVADPEMPVVIADRLRADGIVLRIDPTAVERRRRVKSAAELAGIRRAQRAAEAGMAAARRLLARAVPDGERLTIGGEPLTADAVRAELREACRQAGAPAPANVIVGSLWEGGGHEPGSGPLSANLPIIIDIWPRDEISGCWADMARTFVAGEVPPAVAAHLVLVREVLEAARAAVRPGITGRELHGLACDLFEAAGHATQRSAPGGDGFQFSLGHGVGLAVHESPSIGLSGNEPLMEGDVIAIEPGLWSDATGEVGMEDLLLVTAAGAETLTSFPYDV